MIRCNHTGINRENDLLTTKLQIMGFAFIIIVRILFGVCMVFIIGYNFGGFSKKPGLAKGARVAAILSIVLFILVNIMLMRFAFNRANGQHAWPHCNEPAKTTVSMPHGVDTPAGKKIF